MSQISKMSNVHLQSLIQQLYDYCWNHFGKIDSNKKSRTAALDLLRPEKKLNCLSVLQAYYRLHFQKHKATIEERWSNMDKSRVSPGDLVNYRNVWMQEYYDQEPDEVKAAVEDFRTSHNEQLKINEDRIDWGALDTVSCSTKEPDPKQPEVQAGTAPEIESNNAAPELFLPATAPATTPETEKSKEGQTDDRVTQLLLRQR